MMKLCIYAVGTISGAEAEIMRVYIPRIKQAARQIGLDAPHLTELKPHQPFPTFADTMTAPLIIALDEGGDSLTSRAFASKIENWATSGHSHLCFLIGGADGLPGALKKSATLRLSLSAMTLPHMLARVFLYEQLWRALSIITHHPYHRD